MHFDESDVVRHHLVQRIIRAYDEHKTRLAEEQIPLLPESKAGNGSQADAAVPAAPVEKTATSVEPSRGAEPNRG